MHSGDKNVTNNNNWKKLDHEVNPCAMQIVELAGKNFKITMIDVFRKIKENGKNRLK